ncbi:Thioredoxin-like fold-containing protein [Dioscorea alata]|uniref:Thioredoxin-like fold-containing protein n=1 Tax=Dioscorea alata TaxID=55571 RepID=A0ACB7UAK9_DIOAL|nr:Thioredoxin-like fold-containing protein [Dioscorea alata]
MESKEMIAASAPSETLELSEVDPQLSALLYHVSQQVEIAMHSMLKMASEISESTGEIMEEMEKCKEFVSVKNTMLEEEKDKFQKAAIAVIEMLNGSESM